MVNFNVMKCFNLIFSIEAFKNNIGFYSFFPTIISFFVALFILWLIEFKRISKQINEIISAKKIMKKSTDKKLELEKNSEPKKDEQNSFNSSINDSVNSSMSKDEKLSRNSTKKYNGNNCIKEESKKSLTVFLIGEPDEKIINPSLFKKYKKKILKLFNSYPSKFLIKKII